MGFTVYTLLTTLILGAIVLLVLVPLVPFVSQKHSMQIIVSFFLLIIFRLILPYEFFFTREIEFIYALPRLQRWLEHKAFGLVAVKWIIVIVYVAGLIWTLYKKYFNAEARVRRRIRKNLPALSTPLIDATMTKLQKNKLRKNKKWNFDYEIYYGNEYTQVPMMYGLLKPRIFLPDYDGSQWCLSYWLEHECTHFVLRDSRWMLGIEIVLTLYYFLRPNRLRKMFKHLFEHRCDETVLKGKTPKERRRYARSIDHVLEQSGMQDKLSQENREFLKARKERILNPPKQSLVRKVLFYVLAAGIFILSFTFVIQPRIEPEGFEHGQEHAGELQIDPSEDYAILHEDGSVTIVFGDTQLEATLEVYEESFGNLPLYKESESEDVKNEQK